MKIRYDKLKWPDVPHYGGAIELLDEDDHGLWLFGSAGRPIDRGGEIVHVSDWEVVFLMPRDAWWNAMFTRKTDGVEVYVDIGTPCVRTGDRVSFVDLDLDVFRDVDGDVDIWDVDEFEARRGTYPEEVASRAWDEASLVARALSEHAEPFESAHRRFTDSIGLAVRGIESPAARWARDRDHGTGSVPYAP